MVIFIFLKFADGETFWNFTNYLKYENKYFSDKNI